MNRGRVIVVIFNIVLIFCSILVAVWLIMGYVVFLLSLKSRKTNALFEKKYEEVKSVDYGCAKYYVQKSISVNEKTRLNGYCAYSSQDKPWVICIHGYGGKATGMVEYAEMFRNLGMNVLCVDLRGHGESSGKYYTLGVQDSNDINVWANWLKSEYLANKIILFGISMGGVTALMASVKAPELYSLVISDSAPSDFRQMFMRILKHRIKCFANILMPLVSVYTFLFAKYKISDASAAKYVPLISIPVLYIHGEDDGLVPIKMMHELYEKTVSPKEKLIVSGADHTGAIKVNREHYMNTVSKLIKCYIAYN